MAIALKGRKLEVAVSRTINLGDYESMKIHAGLSGEISRRTDLNEAYEQLFEEVTQQLLKQEEQFLGED